MRILPVALAVLGLFLVSCRGTARAPASAAPATRVVPAAVLPASPEAQARMTATAPLAETPVPPVVTLTSSLETVPWQATARIVARATGGVAVTSIELRAGPGQLAAVEGDALAYELTPAENDGVAPGQAYTLTAEAVDAIGNLGEATLVLRIGAIPGEPAAAPTARAATPAVQPASTPAPAQTEPSNSSATAAVAALASPEPPAAPAAQTSFRVAEITIPTYPFERYVHTVPDPSLGDYPVMVLDRAAYEASNPRPAPVSYTLVILENDYLRLGFLPELGGRLYQAVFKPTGNNELYENPVIKPTEWGPPSPPYPAGANWWLAAGGIEWGFPVEEHGYQWAAEWGYDHTPTDDGGIMLSLFTGDSRRPYAVVDVILPPDKAYFIVRPRITNVWGSEFRFQWWANAMLAPGAANKSGPDLRFVFPNDEMTVHSTGDPTLPAAGQLLSWPVANGRDLSRLGNWNQWLGFFERPAMSGGFSGVYDPAADEGMVRVCSGDVARGSKGFAPGWNDPIDPNTWTDDGSGYVELQGGLTPTFGDWYVLPPGQEVAWEEVWYPVAGAGGVTHAARGGSVYLAPAAGGVRVGIFPTEAVRGELELTLPGMEPLVRQVEISPAAPFSEVIARTGALPDRGEAGVVLTDGRGQTVLSYRGEMPLH